MSYQIHYSPETVKKYPMMTKKPTIRMRNLVVALLLIAAGLWFKTNGVPDFMIPGDPEITRTAAMAFMDQMRIGEPLEEAVVVFCRQILDGAKE